MIAFDGVEFGRGKTVHLLTLQQLYAEAQLVEDRKSLAALGASIYRTLL